jgi:hypothetical protein
MMPQFVVQIGGVAVLTTALSTAAQLACRTRDAEREPYGVASELPLMQVNADRPSWLFL